MQAAAELGEAIAAVVSRGGRPDLTGNEALKKVWSPTLLLVGGLDGIVTMEDIIETLLGLEIVDEKDIVDDMQEYARIRWKRRQAKYKLLTRLDTHE